MLFVSINNRIKNEASFFLQWWSSWISDRNKKWMQSDDNTSQDVLVNWVLGQVSKNAGLKLTLPCRYWFYQRFSRITQYKSNHPKGHIAKNWNFRLGECAKENHQEISFLPFPILWCYVRSFISRGHFKSPNDHMAITSLF